LLLDGKTFDPIGKWPANNRMVPFNYDFWYQPKCGLMLSTEWGTPTRIKQGFNPAHVQDGELGIKGKHFVMVTLNTL
jgi:methanethiol oxidase